MVGSKVSGRVWMGGHPWLPVATVQMVEHPWGVDGWAPVGFRWVSTSRV